MNILRLYVLRLELTENSPLSLIGILESWRNPSLIRTTRRDSFHQQQIYHIDDLQIHENVI